MITIQNIIFKLYRCRNHIWYSVSTNSAHISDLCVLYLCVQFIMMTVFNPNRMVDRDVRQTDLIKCNMFIPPCIPDQLAIHRYRHTVRQIACHFMSRAHLLTMSIQCCIIYIPVAGPHQYKTVAFLLDQMRCSGTVIRSRIIRKIANGRCISVFWHSRYKYIPWRILSIRILISCY